MRTRAPVVLALALALPLLAGCGAGVAGVAASAGGDGLKVGKRYECEATGIQVLVTKPGAATLQCNGQPMALQEPKKTKSAD